MPLQNAGTERIRTLVKLGHMLCFALSVFIIAAFIMLLCCDYHWQDSGFCVGLADGGAATAQDETGEDTPQALEVQQKYREIHEQYPDIAGFLSIPNTGVSYYVFQGADNEYYLHHNRDGKKSFSGEVFLDYRCDVKNPCRHLIVYGHNMRNNSMFGSLDKYKKEDFYKQSPVVTFNTIYGDFRWQIFSVRVVDLDQTRDAIIQTQFESDGEWFAFIQNCQKDSLYPIPVELSENDVVLTLITCSYEYDDCRLLVHAKRID